jgi:hypothetical protein
VAMTVACGGGAQEARAPEAPKAAPAPAPVANVEAPPAELVRYWVAPTDTPQFSARIALGRLSNSPLFRSLWPSLEERVPEPFKPCAKAILDHSQDILLRGHEKRGFAVLSLDAAGLSALQADCKPILASGKAATVKGAVAAFEDEEDLIALVAPNIVLYGTRAEVEAALEPTHKTAALPPVLTLKGDSLVGIHADVPAPKATIDATLAAGPERFTLDANAELPPDLAERVEQSFGALRTQAKERLTEAGAGAFAQALLDAVTLERSGNRVHGALVLKGTVEQQAQALGQLTAMSMFATQRYLANAKAAEAKAVLALIVKDYQESLRDPAKKQKKLVSLPAVPSTVPRGEKYQSKPEEWKAWTAIQFSLTEPQYFQYEVVAAKDGKSATIVARGDLDGDGETSELKLNVTLDAKTGQLTAKGLDETNPLE